MNRPQYALSSDLSSVLDLFGTYFRAETMPNPDPDALTTYHEEFSIAVVSVINTLPYIDSNQFTDEAEQNLDRFSAVLAEFLYRIGQVPSNFVGPPLENTFNLVNDLYEQYYSRISLRCEYLPSFSNAVAAVSSGFSTLAASGWPDVAAPLVTVATCSSGTISASASASASASVVSISTSASAADTCAATLSSVVLDGTVYSCRVVPSCSTIGSSSAVSVPSSGTTPVITTIYE